MKARIVQVNGDELEALEAAQGDLGVPWLMREDGVQGSWWADALHKRFVVDGEADGA